MIRSVPAAHPLFVCRFFLAAEFLTQQHQGLFAPFGPLLCPAGALLQDYVAIESGLLTETGPSNCNCFTVSLLPVVFLYEKLSQAIIGMLGKRSQALFSPSHCSLTVAGCFVNFGDLEKIEGIGKVA